VRSRVSASVSNLRARYRSRLLWQSLGLVPKFEPGLGFGGYGLDYITAENTSQLPPSCLTTTSIVTGIIRGHLKLLFGICTDFHVNTGSCSGSNLKYWIRLLFRPKIQTPARVHSDTPAEMSIGLDLDWTGSGPWRISLILEWIRTVKRSKKLEWGPDFDWVNGKGLRNFWH